MKRCPAWMKNFHTLFSYIWFIAWIPYRKTDKFLYFYCRSPRRVTLFSKSSYLTAHNQIDHKTSCIGSFLKKKQQQQRDVSWNIATAKPELFVALVSSTQPLTNFTKNPSISVVGVLNASLEYYNVLWKMQ